MIKSDIVECRRLVADLRKILFQINTERTILSKSVAENETILKSKAKISSAKKSNCKLGLQLDKARNEADILAFRFALKDRIEATILIDGATYRKCNIPFSKHSLGDISHQVIKVIKYLKMQILGIASIGA